MVPRTKSLDGFGLVETVLVILILAVASFGSYTVWQNEHKTKSTSMQGSAPSSNKSSPSSNVNTAVSTKNLTITDLAKSWTLFNATDNSFSIRVPDGWKLTYISDALFSFTSSDIVYKQGTPADVTVQTEGGYDGLYGFGLNYYKSDLPTFDNTYKKLNNLDLGGTNGAEYEFDTTDPNSEGAPVGTKAYIYFFSKNGHGVEISYDIVPGDTDQTSIVEQSIATLQFN